MYAATTTTSINRLLQNTPQLARHLLSASHLSTTTLHTAQQQQASSAHHRIDSQQQQQRKMSQNNASAAVDKFRLPERYQGSTPSVWVEYIQLAADHKPLNLGQGFTDYPVPAFIREALATAATSANPLMNQYTRGYGHPRLVQALAALYGKVTAHPIDANSEVLVTVGAYEALYAAIQGECVNAFVDYKTR